jgi:hypothetical protein
MAFKSKKQRDAYLKRTEKHRKKWAKEYYRKNRIARLQYQKRWRKENPIKAREQEETQKPAVNKRRREEVANLGDRYVKQQIAWSDHTYKLSTTDIPKELVEAKRMQLKLKRATKDDTI